MLQLQFVLLQFLERLEKRNDHTTVWNDIFIEYGIAI